jgi:hypothetical protein
MKCLKSFFASAAVALLLPLQASPQSTPAISEFMASNGRTLADSEGDFPDWIEIYNPGLAPVNMAGWFLTDDPGDLRKWMFPEVSMPPNSFLLVFASGKNRKDPQSELHANFSLNADGEYLALVRPDGVTLASEFAPAFPAQTRDVSYGYAHIVETNRFVISGATARVLVPAGGQLGVSWTQPDFNDAGWLTGPTGIGYESESPGFAVRNIKANVQVGSLALAESVIANPSQQSGVVVEQSPVLNYFGTGSEGRYGNNRPFPGTAPGADIDDFVIEAFGTITIPQSGSWTFGVNSDDGFSLVISNQFTSFTISHPTPRGPADTLGVFNVPAAGDYGMRLVFYERGGGSGLELFATSGSFGTWEQRFRLVGDVANGGLAVRSAALGGAGGLGLRSSIATDLQVGMKGQNASAYVRIPFTVNNPTSIESLLFRIKYDDGFIAYLNGTEIARKNAPAAAEWNSTAIAERPSDLANSFEEFNVSLARAYLRSGLNVLAIHGLNTSRDDVDFLLLPELLEYRITGAGFRYFPAPTPGQPNNQGVIAFAAETKFSHAHGFYDAPFNLTLSSPTAGASIRYTTNGLPPTASTGMLYTSPVYINGTTVIRAAAFKEGYESSSVQTRTYIFLDDVIRQSPNGEPPPGWPSAWGGNVVDYGMDQRVVNNPLYSGTIIGDLKSIPTFSIVMDLKDLFDPAIGIYANPGQDGRAWERPASLELINPDGTKGFQANAGIRIRGGFSRSTSNPKHAFRLFFRAEYGEAKLKYPLFGDDGTDSFDKIDLRTFQNYSWSFQGDSRGIFIRDQFNRDAQLSMGHHAERGDFYHLYINGHYWGLFNTCERPEASYGEAYYGGRKSDFDTVKVEAGPYEINATDGDLEAWRRLWNLMEAGVGTDAAYQRVQGNNPDGTRNLAYEVLLDIDNLIDYMLIIYYGGNLDAPISNFLGNTRPNNWYGLRDRTGNAGFRFFVHDAEHTLLNLNEDRTGPWPAGSNFIHSNPQRMFQQLWDNAEFRMRVADRVHRHFFNGGVLTPESARALFMKRKNEIDRAVVGESARWGDAKRSTPLTRADWLNAINTVLNTYLPNRSAVVLNQLRSKNLYPVLAAPVFNQFGGNVPRGFQLTMNAPSGSVYYTTDGSDPRLPGGGLSGSARLYSGSISIFETAHVKARARGGTAWSALNEAQFTVIQTYTGEDLLITEIMYQPPRFEDQDGDNFEFIELKNVSKDELDLSGVHFTSGIRFSFPHGSSVAPGAFVVLVKNSSAFQLKYPGAPIHGIYQGNLSNGGETLALAHATGQLIVSVTYENRPPWPSTAAGTGFSIVPVNPNLNMAPNDPSNWRASTNPGGSPGVDDPAANLPVVWITEILTHTDLPQVDAVELHNPGLVRADISFWYLTDDKTTPRKFRFPAGTIIEPGGYLVVTENDFNAPNSSSSFAFSSRGEQVYLFSADGAGNLTGFSDGFSFGAAENGISFGRYTTSTGDVHYPPQTENSFGAPNAGPKVGPVVISEIQYHPAGGDVEFVELKNITDKPVALYDVAHPTNTWRINGIGFAFPSGLELAANGLILVVASDPGDFRVRHNVPAAVPVLGPFAGVLQNSGERIQLLRPDAPDITPEGVFVPQLVVEEVRYSPLPPWPQEAAGHGPSLERVSVASYGNDPINWRASPGPASPGLNNSGNRPPVVGTGPAQQHVASLFPFSVSLSGSGRDDGLPLEPGKLSFKWRQISGPPGVFFADSTRTNTTASLPGIGHYVLRLTASDGEFEAGADLSVTIERSLADTSFVEERSSWKYLDDGSNQGTAWRMPGFNDAGWKSGPGPLGYGRGHIVTAVNGGPTNARFVTTYFRRTFTVSNASAVRGLRARLMRDDGAVVYINGAEVLRSNMPQGPIDFQTYALNIVGGADESTYFSSDIDPTVLVGGVNLIAVEVHQVNASSSDVAFDLELVGETLPANLPPLVSAGPDQVIDFPEPAFLSGAVSDDGLPVPPGLLTIAWAKISGPGEVAFDPAFAPTAVATFSLPGEYTLQLAAFDGESSRTSTVQVRVRETAYAEWLLRHFTASELADPGIGGEGADPDEDGHSNMEEFITGTDPRDPGSVLRVETVERQGDSVFLRFNAMPGRPYRFEYCDDLNAGWQLLIDIPPQTQAEIMRVEDTSPQNNGARYYRVFVR